MSRLRGALRALSALVATLCVPAEAPCAAEKTDFATLVYVFDQMVMQEQSRVSKWTSGDKQLTLKVTPNEPYEAVYTFWYAPEFGFHVRYRSQYKGATTERPVSWTVSSVSPPVATR